MTRRDMTIHLDEETAEWARIEMEDEAPHAPAKRFDLQCESSTERRMKATAPSRR